MFALTHINELLTMESAYKKDGRKLLPEDGSVIKDATIVYDKTQIHWAGLSSEVPREFKIDQMIDLSGYVVVPEICDSHTHLIFGGNRSFEYEMRLNGATYEELANAGGGILHTMQHTAELDKTELFNLTCDRIEKIHSYGVGTIEIKSGYGLEYKKEKQLTQIIHDLKEHFQDKIQIFSTYMAAHAVPKSFSSSLEYMDQVVIPLLKDLAPKGFIDAVDIFHEVGYFSEQDVRKLSQVAKQLNIPIKSHADEFNDNKGAILACDLGALSADHLLKTQADGIERLARSNTVATLLPGTGFFLGKTQVQARAFLDAGVKVSIASDFNPGSCHWDNVCDIAFKSAPTYKMNSTEMWAAITLNAGHALGLKNQGAIVPGLKPRFSYFQAQTLADVFYNWGANLAHWPSIP